MARERLLFGGMVLVCQMVFLILYGLLVEYDDSANAKVTANSRDMAHNGSDPKNNMLKQYYPSFQDVHVMIFIGFGFLMTFLKKYGYGSISINLLIGAFVLQWSILVLGIFDLKDHKIKLSITSMINADFAAAAVLISFGAVLGKTSPIQMLVLAFIEIIMYGINQYIGIVLLQAVDIGGSMFIHTFGAYFGLTVARILWTKDTVENPNEGSVYHSDVFSMIGTVFLWMFWPSFNSALAPGDDQHRAVINTYLSLAACCLITFAVSSMLNRHGKFEMVHIQNATLAGGVAVGTSANLMVDPVGALTIGTVAGLLSVLGFVYVTPWLASKLKVHDTCGVNNLHGMPGILAGVVGILMSGFASEVQYGYSLYEIFPARAPEFNTTKLHEVQSVFSAVEAGSGRSAGVQAGYQILALLVTIGMGVVGGIITGFLLKLSLFDQPDGEEKPVMDDNVWFETPDDIPGGNIQENPGETTYLLPSDK